MLFRRVFLGRLLLCVFVVFVVQHVLSSYLHHVFLYDRAYYSMLPSVREPYVMTSMDRLESTCFKINGFEAGSDPRNRLRRRAKAQVQSSSCDVLPVLIPSMASRADLHPHFAPGSSMHKQRSRDHHQSKLHVFFRDMMF